jgi:hypothetical protein
MITTKPFSTSIEYFAQLRAIWRPWLGEVEPRNLPANPEDITAFVSGISGYGFTSFLLLTRHTEPDWINPRWRTSTGITCPRCGAEIHALLKSHRIGPRTITGAPHVFCRCVRLKPSRLPSLEFFISHWETVLEALTFYERVAGELQRERELQFPRRLSSPAALAQSAATDCEQVT